MATNNKRQLLDPIGSICHIVSLTFKPLNTKIGINKQYPNGIIIRILKYNIKYVGFVIIDLIKAMVATIMKGFNENVIILMVAEILSNIFIPGK